MAVRPVSQYALPVKAARRSEKRSMAGDGPSSSGLQVRYSVARPRTVLSPMVCALWNLQGDKECDRVSHAYEVVYPSPGGCSEVQSALVWVRAYVLCVYLCVLVGTTV